MDLREGLNLTVLGVGGVFITMMGLAVLFEIFNKIFSLSEKKNLNKAEDRVPVKEIEKSNNLTAAIVAAIECYREMNVSTIPRINHGEERWSASCKNFTMISNKES